MLQRQINYIRHAMYIKQYYTNYKYLEFKFENLRENVAFADVSHTLETFRACVLNIIVNNYYIVGLTVFDIFG